MSESDKHHKLFVKNICMVCLNKSMSCYYCNGAGTVFVEASDKGVGRWLASIDKDKKDVILEHMKGFESEDN